MATEKSVYCKNFEKALELGINHYPPQEGDMILSRNHFWYYTGNSFVSPINGKNCFEIALCYEDGEFNFLQGGVRENDHMTRWIAVPRDTYKAEFAYKS